MKTLIVYKFDNEAAYLTAIELCRQLRTKNISAEILSSSNLSNNVGSESWNVVFVLGGDGTILRTARFFAGTDTPLLGINFGKIGFLSSIEPCDLSLMLKKLEEKQYDLEKRLMLNININRDYESIYQGLALNDGVIRSKVMHAIDIQLFVNNSPYANYRGDGIICATPTGSTAYSYSANGPIIDLRLKALVVTPISPQLSSSRAIVVDADSRLEFKVSCQHPTAISIDGQDEINLVNDDLIEISQSPHTVTFMQIDSISSIKRITRNMKNNRLAHLN